MGEARSMTRNLIAHIYPRSCGQKWRRTADHLLHRWRQFDAKRIISVAVDGTTDTLDDVRRALNDGVEFIEVWSTGLQEVGSFGRLMERVQSCPPDDVTYYVHAKGAAHAGKNRNRASHLWCDAMA